MVLEADPDPRYQTLNSQNWKNAAWDTAEDKTEQITHKPCGKCV